MDTHRDHSRAESRHDHRDSPRNHRSHHGHYPSPAAEMSQATDRRAAGHKQPKQGGGGGFTPQHIRILHLSDTHNMLSAATDPHLLPAADILVHTGDFTNRGSVEEFEQFNDWLDSVAHLYPHRVVIPGNHDMVKKRHKWDLVRAYLPAATDVPLFEEINIHGLRIYGSPWHWWPQQGKASTSRLGEIPEGLDILLTHEPPKGVRDTTVKDDNVGSLELYHAGVSKKPRIHLFGHIHEDAGIASYGSTVAINSSLMSRDKRRGLANAAHLITASKYVPHQDYVFKVTPVLCSASDSGEDDDRLPPRRGARHEEEVEDEEEEEGEEEDIIFSED